MKVFRSEPPKFVELKEKGFNHEKVIQELLEKNIGSIFPGLEFVKSEYEIYDLRPDTIAFDREKKSFVILEYKNIKNKSVIDQGVSYYQLLREHQEAFLFLITRNVGSFTTRKTSNGTRHE